MTVRTWGAVLYYVALGWRLRGVYVNRGKSFYSIERPPAVQAQPLTTNTITY